MPSRKDIDRSKIGRSARRKGVRFESWVVKRLTDAGLPAVRCYQYTGADTAPDVMVRTESGDVVYWVECKRGARPSIAPALEATRSACATQAPSACAVVVFQFDGKRPMICMDLDDWLDS